MFICLRLAAKDCLSAASTLILLSNFMMNYLLRIDHEVEFDCERNSKSCVTSSSSGIRFHSSPMRNNIGFIALGLSVLLVLLMMEATL
jgi:hypothetical protein